MSVIFIKSQSQKSMVIIVTENLVKRYQWFSGENFIIRVSNDYVIHIDFTNRNFFRKYIFKNIKKKREKKLLRSKNISSLGKGGLIAINRNINKCGQTSVKRTCLFSRFALHSLFSRPKSGYHNNLRINLGDEC